MICLSCLTRATASSRLPAHQRRVLVTIALSDVPIDVLAERLNTTRGALAPFPSQAKGMGPQDAAGQLGYRPAVSPCPRGHRLGGCQLTLAALVPALRRFGAEVPPAAARRFNQVAWIAFAVLIVTGIWNVAAAWSEISHSAGYRDTLIVKLVVVSISGITAALHARGRSAVSLAVFGALTGVSALAALFLGVLLAG